MHEGMGKGIGGRSGQSLSWESSEFLRLASERSFQGGGGEAQ